jgi:hypothetical protein
MTGKLYIDGQDAYTAFGVSVADGGYRGLVQYPSLKTPDSNNWAEQDGIEVDLTDLKLDSKTFGIIFNGVLDFSVRNIVDYLSDDAYHEFDFREAGVVRTLRLTGNSARRTVGALKTFTLEFADDNPLDGYEYEAPTPVASCWQTDFEIDGKPLSDYGVWVKDGTHDELVKSPSVKQNLLVNTPAINGAQYDGEDVFFEAKDVNIKCHIRADIFTFWRNYNALLYDLVRPGERRFFYGARNEEYPFHYKSASVSKFTLVGGEVWCDFDLTLVFTSFRLGEMEYVLANSDGALIALDDTGIFINTAINR